MKSSFKFKAEFEEDELNLKWFGKLGPNRRNKFDMDVKTNSKRTTKFKTVAEVGAAAAARVREVLMWTWSCVAEEDDRWILDRWV